MKTEAIVASAGIGKRLKAGLRKPYLLLSGRPVLIRTLKVLSACAAIGKIIVVVNKLDKERCERLIKRYRVKKVKAVITGGAERSDSVSEGLKIIDKDTDVVVIHDGVRPFITEDIIKRSVDCAKRFGACVVGVPVKATIKEVASRQSPVTGQFIVKKTLDRSNIWEIQTPQAFKRDLISKAYRKFGKMKATDDAMLVEKLGVKVRVVRGSYKNIKITTPEDLLIAEGLMKCA